ncbi:MAG: hypothetical protein ACUVWR_08575, partial [Anaerolineae bacterium]
TNRKSPGAVSSSPRHGQSVVATDGLRIADQSPSAQHRRAFVLLWLQHFDSIVLTGERKAGPVLYHQG